MSAVDIVLEKARGYLYHGRYPQIVVFSCNGTELDKLVHTFGGHSYHHGSGFTWVLSKKAELAFLMAKVKPFLPSRNGFEKLLGERHN